MSDAIESAFVRLTWAHKLIRDFDSEFRMFLSVSPYRLVPDVNEQARECIYRIKYKDPLPARLSLIAGDAIHNLRSVLDGLFWALLQKYGARDNISFPLRKTPEGFQESRIKLQRIRIPDGVLDSIEDFQPYKRGQILREIHDLDIVNEHRAILVTANVPSKFNIECPIPFIPMFCIGPAEDGATIARLRFIGEGKANLNTQFGFEIAFNEVGDVYGERVWHVLMIAHDFIQDEVIPVFNQLLRF